MKTFLRCVPLFILASSPLLSGDSTTRMIADFRQQTELDGWVAVNDGVMGGLSQGAPKLKDGVLRFSGNLSLENNGGFSSVRMSRAINLEGHSGIRLRVKGDGRTYQLRLQTDARYGQWPVSFSGDFPTKAGEWTEVEVPFEALRQSFRGRTLSGYEFDPKNIELVGLLLADKKAGAFSIAVEWLQAYR